MADKCQPHGRSAPIVLISLLLFSLSIPPAQCRALASEPTEATATLDVADALGKAIRVLTSDGRTQQSLQQEKPKHRGHHHHHRSRSSGSNTLILPLQPRDAVSPPAHADYRSLTLARLARDEARVRAINARLQLAVHGVRKSDLVPLVEDSGLAAAAVAAATPGGGDGLSGPVVSGTSQGSGEYFSRVGIGSPAKSLYMVLDTGSDVTWVQCQPCTDCYQQADPVFEPAASSTYAPLSCGSDQCRRLDVSACRNDSCLYQVSYGDGSYTVGDFATETVSLGGASVPAVALGCGHDNEGLFVGAAGLLGLGGGDLSFPSQVSASSFSYCLVDRDSSSSSTLEFGTVADSDPSSVSAPLLRNHKMDTFYYVGLTGISVGGAMLSIPPSAFAVGASGEGGVIVDSGTAVTRLQNDAYASLRDAFSKGTAGLPSAAGMALFDTCYDLSGRNTVEVPAVSFHFPGGKSLRLPAKNYLIPVDSNGTFCLAFAPTSQALSIIGNVQQQGTRVGVDLANSVVLFSPNKC
ncbi:hypothetical protein Taro_053150 [Colocasia esculenta]|uniref:Peptidase A1 domain-containing protein n=1 Tax=Colocasia esculenta TaxID=4460 RepID=A0A843XM72_COLES|nr:hypothetical protein [Colocasia esculenta]